MWGGVTSAGRACRCGEMCGRVGAASPPMIVRDTRSAVINFTRAPAGTGRLLGPDPIQHKPDRVHHELRLVVLNGVPAPDGDDVDRVVRSPEPVVVHLPPYLVPPRGLGHVVGVR